MSQLTPIQLEDGTVIYIEATSDMEVPSEVTSETDSEPEVTRGSLGKEAKGLRELRHLSNFRAIESTIKAYTSYTLNAFKQVAIANVDKVTLEFGIKIAGEAGVPYVTKGTAESNLKITVECSFSD